MKFNTFYNLTCFYSYQDLNASHSGQNKMPQNYENIKEKSQLKDQDSVNTALVADKSDDLDVITTQPEKKTGIPSENFQTLPSKNTGQTDCVTCVMLFCNVIQECWIACIGCFMCCDGQCCAECLNGTVEGLGECLQGCGECCLACTQCS